MKKEVIMGSDKKPYCKNYDAVTKTGWLSTESAVCSVISVHGNEVFTRLVSPVTGDEAIIRIATNIPSDYGIASICKRLDGTHINYKRVTITKFINGEYELPEEE